MTVSHDDLRTDFSRLEGKVDTIIDIHEKRLDKAEENIGSLRRWRSGVVMTASALAALFGYSMK